MCAGEANACARRPLSRSRRVHKPTLALLILFARLHWNGIPTLPTINIRFFIEIVILRIHCGARVKQQVRVHRKFGRHGGIPLASLLRYIRHRMRTGISSSRITSCHPLSSMVVTQLVCRPVGKTLSLNTRQCSRSARTATLSGKKHSMLTEPILTHCSRPRFASTTRPDRSTTYMERLLRHGCMKEWGTGNGR